MSPTPRAAPLPGDWQLLLDFVAECDRLRGGRQLRARIVARVRASFAAEPAAVCALAALPLETALAAAAADGGGGGVAAWGPECAAALRRANKAYVAAATAAPPAGAPADFSAQISARHCGALDALMRARPPFDPAVVRRVAVLLLRASRRAHRARAATPLVYRRWALLRLLRDPLVYAARPLHDLPGGGDGDGAGWVAAVEWPQPASAAAATAALKVCEAGLRRHPSDAALHSLRLILLHWRLGAAPALADLAPLKPELEAAVAATSGGGGGGGGGGDDDEGEGEGGGDVGVWLLWLQMLLRASDAAAQPAAPLALLRAATTALHARAAPLKVACARWLAASLPLARCRAFRSQLLALPPAPRDALAPLIAQEDAADDEALRARPTAPLAPPAAALYDLACREHGGASPALWLRYAARLLARRDFAAGSALHRRALKALDDAHHATFAEGYQRLLANEDGAVFTETAVDF